jgi:hypothetical protein
MKKTNKVNPVTFFRKANEARQKIVKSSLKKAQDGIEMNDDMINKSGYGEKRNVYTRPETSKAGKNAVYQGPVSTDAEYMIKKSKKANPGMNRYNETYKKEVENASRNPKNSRKQIADEYLYSKDLKVKPSREAKKAYKKDYKDLPSNAPQKKENRRLLAQVAGSLIAAPFVGKAIGRGYEKRKGGFVKTKKK